MTPDFQRKKKFLDLIAPSAHGVKGQLSPGKTYTVYATADPEDQTLTLEAVTPDHKPMYTFVCPNDYDGWIGIFGSFYDLLTPKERYDYQLTDIPELDCRISILEDPASLESSSACIPFLEKANKEADAIYDQMFDDVFELAEPYVKKAQAVCPEIDISDSCEKEDILITIDGYEATEDNLKDWVESLDGSYEERIDRLVAAERAGAQLCADLNDISAHLNAKYKDRIDAVEKDVRYYYDNIHLFARNQQKSTGEWYAYI